MKIFGIEFKTRRELKALIAQLKLEAMMTRNECDMAQFELNEMKKAFPFELGQTVYDVQLRNDKGRYATKNVSLEHSIITEVVVSKKNYFGLVERYNKKDVFLSYNCARTYIESICVKK